MNPRPPRADLRRRPLAYLALVNAAMRLGVVPVSKRKRPARDLKQMELPK